MHGPIEVAPIPRAEWPRPTAITREQRRPFGAEGDVALGPGGLLYGVCKDKRKPHVAAWVVGGELHTAEDTPLPGGRTAYLAARDDGAAALIGLDFDSLWEVDFEGHVARRLLKHEESLSDIGYGPDDRILMLAGTALDAYRRVGSRAVLDRRWHIEGYGMMTLHEGRLVAVKRIEDGRDGITLYGFHGDSLRLLARANTNVGALFAEDGRVFFEHNGHEAEFYELAGVSVLRALLDARPESFPEVPVLERGPTDDVGLDEESDARSDDDALVDEDEDLDEAPPKSPDEVVVEPAPGRVGLRSLGKKSPLRRQRDEAIPKDVKALFGARATVVHAGAGDLYTGWKKDGKTAFRYAIYGGVRGKELLDTELKSSAQSTLICMSPDRTSAFVPTDGDGKLWRVDLRTGKATLIRDFSKEKTEKEIYVLQALAHERVLVGTSSETWIFSVAGGTPRVEIRGQLDIREAEILSEGRVAVLQASSGRPLRVWGIFEDGVRTLAAFKVTPASFHASDGKFYVNAEGDLGWFEIVNVDDAWATAQRSASETRYPRIDLSEAPPPREDEERDEDEDDEDEDEDEESEEESEDEDEVSDDDSLGDDDDEGGDEDDEDDDDD
ncbi:Hypothetical protein CAP_5674 [Chondromyces apiculatus DSM 436]|uniref:Uncharacterized protein n=1 Tax=Chondromyces apiculatus DSM 436 TaxID=1192034 RepID=A0A017T2V6_9BACT|nr:Hypothetical protein CAP_5674 [Chondromyces apiculatus DSM 436]